MVGLKKINMKERFSKREFCRRVFYDRVFNVNTGAFETVKVLSTINVDYNSQNVAHCYVSNEKVLYHGNV